MLASRAGVSRTTLYSVESGSPAVSLGTYLRILAHFELEADIALLAADDAPGRRIQDLQLLAKRASRPSVRRGRTGRRNQPPYAKKSVPQAEIAPAPIAPAANRLRPRSLREVAILGREHGDIDSFLREFLDEFYLAPDPEVHAAMLSEMPPLADDERTNAYLGAVAEHLALRNGLEVPEWSGEACRFLRRAYFPSGLESLKASLLVESPAAFRRRLIFVGADPLYRPRKDSAGIGA